MPVKYSTSSISSNEGNEKSTSEDEDEEVFVELDDRRALANQSRFISLPRSEDFSEVTVVDDDEPLVVGAKLTADPNEWADERSRNALENDAQVHFRENDSNRKFDRK